MPDGELKSVALLESSRSLTVEVRSLGAGTIAVVGVAIARCVLPRSTALKSPRGACRRLRVTLKDLPRAYCGGSTRVERSLPILPYPSSLKTTEIDQSSGVSGSLSAPKERSL